ncbi:MAG TPA: PEP-CTERM sorting domain-containing protein [Pyrinomonadaceae bacterium]|nr:PEP-CTERM sorting domain-containing protein [Pyrinomonadaceae bacterium]
MKRTTPRFGLRFERWLERINKMNLTPAQFFGNKPLRRLCAALSVFILTAAPVLAEPVTINQVVRTVTNSNGITDLTLNTLVSQDPVAPGTKGSQSGPRTDTATESVLSGTTVTSKAPALGVEIVEEGEVEGTICDCGEMLVAAAGAFPKWPFLFLAAVPLVFINNCDSCNDTPSSTPTPTPPSTPTPTPTPEPASLLLFGTGLLAAGAGLRRRYTRSKLVEQSTAQEEK